jgi:hypothetical protein
MATNEHWQVKRTGGVLPPGFTKRFSDDGSSGTTYFLGVPIGAFDVVDVPAHGDDDGGHGVELRYRLWPVVDVLDGRPDDAAPRRGSGNIAIAGMRTRFCRFRLER